MVVSNKMFARKTIVGLSIAGSAFCAVLFAVGPSALLSDLGNRWASDTVSMASTLALDSAGGDFDPSPEKPSETLQTDAEGAPGYALSAVGDIYTWRIRDPSGAVLREFSTEYPTTTGEVWTWRRDFFHGAGRPLASEGNPALGWPFGKLRFHADHLGSTRIVTDGNGNLAGSHTYSPYGEEVATSSDRTAYRFTGHERDTDAMDYMRARYYRNDLARFVSPDAAKSGWNGYAYAANNPMSMVDPDGNYQEPFHGALTYHLALAAGMSADDAGMIAIMTAGVDHHPETHPLLNAFNKKGPFWHFRDSKEVANDYFAVLRLLQNNPDNDTYLRILGMYMHTLQDVGFDGNCGPHTCLGPPGMAPWPKMGHPEGFSETGRISLWFLKTVDEAWQNPVKNTKLARSVYNLLKATAKARGSQYDPCDECAEAAIHNLMNSVTQTEINAYLTAPGIAGSPSYADMVKEQGWWDKFDFTYGSRMQAADFKWSGPGSVMNR